LRRGSIPEFVTKMSSLEALESRNPVGFSRGCGQTRVSIEPHHGLPFGYGFGIHLFFRVGSRQTGVCWREIRIHLQRLLVLLDRLVVLPRQIISETHRKAD